MKASISYILAIIAALMLVAGVQAQNPNAQSMNNTAQSERPPTAMGLEFSKTDVDFGKVDEGEKVEVVFPVTNGTDKVIKIVDLNTGCGCTQAKDNPSEIAPGEQAEIKVEYNTHGRRGPTIRRMSLTTDEQGRSTYELRFTGEVISPLYWDTAIVDFGEIDSGMSHTKNAVLKSTIEGFEIQSVSVADERLKAEVTEEKPFEVNGKKGTAYTLTVTVPDNYPVSDFFSRIELTTNDPSKTPRPLSIRGSVLGDIASTPKRIYAVLTPDSATSVTVSVKSRSGEPIKIKSVEAPEEFPITFEIEDGKKPSEKTLIATMTADDKARTRQGDVVVNIVKGEGDTAEEQSMDLRTIMVIRHTRIIRNTQTSPNRPANQNTRIQNPNKNAVPEQNKPQAGLTQ